MRVISILSGVCFFRTAYTVSAFAIGLAIGSAGLESLFAMIFIGAPAAVVGFALAIWAQKSKAELLPEYIGLGIVGGLLIAFCIWFYIWQRDWPAIVLHADYYNEEGFELYLREGGTFKILETGWSGGAATYGTYTIADNVVFLSREIELSGGCLLDQRFVRKGKYLHFTCKNGVIDRQSIGPLYIKSER